MNFKYHILIVEDDINNLKEWEKILESDSRVIYKAHNGKEALKKIKEEEIHLVITDIDIPNKQGKGIDGFELIKKLTSQMHKLNVIFTVDAKQSMDDVIHGLEDGAVGYLVEPLHPELTRAKVAIFERLFVSRKELKMEKQKSESLLKNILPPSTIDELKAEGISAARQYKNASVMFTDFVQFTEYSQHIKATELVNKLNTYFSAFDDIVPEFHLEKIKTIGDAYMAVCGVPLRTKHHAVLTCLAALKIVEYCISIKQQENNSWDIRIGINSGPLVAGIVGKSKYQYDIWGDTVNVANRLESNSESNRINISATTFELVKDYFDCTYRGKRTIKNHEQVDMYFLNRLKPEFAENAFSENNRLSNILND